MKNYLHLENGSVFEGELLTKSTKKAITGEIVFFTGMTGYQEVLTDPSYKDQIVIFTYPLIGNYGINEHDFESKKPHVAGVIVYEGNMSHSHYQAKYSIGEYLDKWNIPLLSHVDTRAVVKNIRQEGSMQASRLTGHRLSAAVESATAASMMATMSQYSSRTVGSASSLASRSMSSTRRDMRPSSPRMRRVTSRSCEGALV